MKTLLALSFLTATVALTSGCMPSIRASATGFHAAKPSNCPIKYGFIKDTSGFEQVGYVQIEHIEGDPFAPQNVAQIAPYACELGGEYLGLLGTMESWTNGNGANYIVLVPNR
jgi:hypothetical protein